MTAEISRGPMKATGAANHTVAIVASKNSANMKFARRRAIQRDLIADITAAGGSLEIHEREDHRAHGHRGAAMSLRERDRRYDGHRGEQGGDRARRAGAARHRHPPVRPAGNDHDHGVECVALGDLGTDAGSLDRSPACDPLPHLGEPCPGDSTVTHRTLAPSARPMPSTHI